MHRDKRTEEFLSLYNQEQRGIHAYIRTLLFRRDDAEDVFQETCIALWRSFDQYKPGTNFGAWAREIARYRVLAHGKKRQEDRHVFSVEVLSQLANDVESDAEAIEQRRVALANCLSRLPVEDRDILDRRYQGKTTTIELAQEMGHPLSTLYKMLTRIRRSLLECVRATLIQEEHTG